MNHPPAVLEARSSNKMNVQKEDKQKEKPPQTSKETEIVLALSSDQSGGQPRSPYNLRQQQ